MKMWYVASCGRNPPMHSWPKGIPREGYSGNLQKNQEREWWWGNGWKEKIVACCLSFRFDFPISEETFWEIFGMSWNYTSFIQFHPTGYGGVCVGCMVIDGKWVIQWYAFVLRMNPLNLWSMRWASRCLPFELKISPKSYYTAEYFQ